MKLKLHSIPFYEKLGHAFIQKSAAMLHMMPPPDYAIRLEVFNNQNKDGHGLVQKYDTYGHSWTRWIYSLLVTQTAYVDLIAGGVGTGYLTIKDTGGGTRGEASRPCYNGTSEDVEAVGNGFRGAVNDNTQGIVVGSGTNAESFEDYVLQTIIANGTGAGQLSHVQMEAYTKSYDGPSKTYTFTYIRYFNNNSGGNVLVNEVGLYGRIVNTVTGTKWNTCMSRDKLGATVTIPNTGQLKVTYTITATLPA